MSAADSDPSAVYGIVAEFDNADAIAAATRAATAAGYTRLEAYGPYPLLDIAERLGSSTLVIPLIATVAALAGAASTYWLQYWMNALDYPLNVGGRPLNSWPAFIPAAIIVGVLAAGAFALIGMLALCGLPRLEHPVFETPGFERASQDRFFLCIERADPRFEYAAVRALLEGHRPIGVHEVRA